MSAPIRDTARLHPRTVTDHDKHKKTKSRTKARQRSKVTGHRTDPRVLKVAKDLTKGRDNVKLKFVGPEEVWVINDV